MEKPAWGEEVYLRGVSSGAVGCSPECGSSPEATAMDIATGAGRDDPRPRRGSGSPVRPAEPFPSTRQPFPPVAMSYTWVCLAQSWTSGQLLPLLRRTLVGAVVFRRLKQSIFLSGIFLNVAKTAFALAQENKPPPT